MKNIITSFVQSFIPDFEEATADLDVAAAKLASKYRVTVAVPSAHPEGRGGRYVVYSRVASDVALMEWHDAHPVDFDAFEIAEAGEVLNLLVEPGYHRIHAHPLPSTAKRGWLGTRGMLLAIPADPERGELLFAGDVYSDVGLA